MSALDVTQYVTHEHIREAIEDSLAWNLPIDHWSPSSLTMLRRCPYQWQQRYIFGRKQRPAEAPVMGSTVHAAFERNFEQKIASHDDLPLAELLQWYMDEGFPRVVYDEQEKAGEDVLWDTGPEETRRRGYQIVAAYHDTVAPRIQPLRVETSFSVDFGAAVPVIGRFDVERETSTIDYKTGKRARRQPDEAWRLQGGVYMEATGKPVEFHSLSATASTNAVTIVTPLEAEELLVAPSQIERAEMRRTIRSISNEACFYMAMFGPDDPWPTHGRFHSWACNYCGFRPGCPAWRTE